MDKRARKMTVLAILAAAGLVALTAQEPGPRGRESFEPRPTKAYIVGGVRHGASHFPRADTPFIKARTPGEMDFLHYHTYDEVVAFLKKWAADYPQLVDLYSVGKSFEGRDIWQITITNKSTGRDTDKPAMFIEGNRHSGEVTAGGAAPRVAKKAGPARGGMPVDPADPSGRLMKRAEAGKGDYALSAEGIDNDGDGRVNEDGIGGAGLLLACLEK